jgi:hypothetical protein
VERVAEFVIAATDEVFGRAFEVRPDSTGVEAAVLLILEIGGRSVMDLDAALGNAT